jgi:hypothetical protein
VLTFYQSKSSLESRFCGNRTGTKKSDRELNR